MKLTKPVYGHARKAALLAVLVSALGWLIYLVFFGLTVTDKTVRDRTRPSFLPHWLFLALGPLLYVILIVYLALNSERHFLQSIINVVFALYLLCGGGIIYTDWIIYYLESDYSTRYLFEFGSCTLAVAGVVFYTLFAPWFKRPIASTRQSPSPIPEDGNRDTSTIELKPTEIQSDETNALKHNNSYQISSAFTLPKDTNVRADSLVKSVKTQQVDIPSSPPVVADLNRDTEDPMESTTKPYTSLIPQNREEPVLYADTMSPPEDDDIYMNEPEHEAYDNVEMYEEVSEMRGARGRQEDYEAMTSPQQEYAEIVDGQEEQYEVLNP